MTISDVWKGNYSDGQTADGEDLLEDLNTIKTEYNAHEVSSPAEHAAGSMTATLLATDSVETAKIKADAVTSAKIADSQILGEHIYEGVNYTTMAETEIGTGALDSDPTDADPSVLYDADGLTSNFIDMILVPTTGTGLNKRYSIGASTATGYVTLHTAALGGGNAYSDGVRSGDTFRIVKTPIRSGHIGLNEVRSEHFLDSSITPVKCAAGVAGWHGHLTRIVLTPLDFMSGNTSFPMAVNNEGGNIGSGANNAVAYAAAAIPDGYKATGGCVYGNGAAQVATFYACDIATATTTSILGSTGIGLVASFSVALTASTSNYVSVQATRASSNQIYGGYISIELA